MNNKLIVILLFATFLFACESTPEKADDAVAVEDQGTNLDDTANAQTFPSEDDERSGMSSLDDPQSLLAVRIIYFEYDSAKLTSESIAILETHGNFIAGNGEVKVRLEGHGDERGSREYNIALGDRRAQSVRRVLLFQGASSDQVETVSYGEEKPMDLGHDDAAWSMNRRVELIYTVN